MAAQAATHPRPPSAGTAETVVLVALILQVIGGAIVIGGISWFFGFSYLHPFPYAWVAVMAAAIVAILVVVFLYFAYTYSYQRIQRGDYQGAQAPTLVIGILSLFLGIIPGILYIIGYVKLGDAVREAQAPSPWYAPAYGVPPPPLTHSAQVACKGCGRVYMVGQFPFCPNCGQKMGA